MEIFSTLNAGMPSKGTVFRRFGVCTSGIEIATRLFWPCASRGPRPDNGHAPPPSSVERSRSSGARPRDREHHFLAPTSTYAISPMCQSPPHTKPCFRAALPNTAQVASETERHHSPFRSPQTTRQQPAQRCVCCASSSSQSGQPPFGRKHRACSAVLVFAVLPSPEPCSQPSTSRPSLPAQPVQTHGPAPVTEPCSRTSIPPPAQHAGPVQHSSSPARSPLPTPSLRSSLPCLSTSRRDVTIPVRPAASRFSPSAYRKPAGPYGLAAGRTVMVATL